MRNLWYKVIQELDNNFGLQIDEQEQALLAAPAPSAFAGEEDRKRATRIRLWPLAQKRSIFSALLPRQPPLTCFRVERGIGKAHRKPICRAVKGREGKLNWDYQLGDFLILRKKHPAAAFGGRCSGWSRHSPSLYWLRENDYASPPRPGKADQKCGKKHIYPLTPPEYVLIYDKQDFPNYFSINKENYFTREAFYDVKRI